MSLELVIVRVQWWHVQKFINLTSWELWSVRQDTNIMPIADASWHTLLQPYQILLRGLHYHIHTISTGAAKRMGQPLSDESCMLTQIICFNERKLNWILGVFNLWTQTHTWSICSMTWAAFVEGLFVYFYDVVALG